MKSKKLLLLFLLSMFFTATFGVKQQIELSPGKLHEGNTRSLLTTLTLSHAGNTLYIYSSTSLNNLQIKVINNVGNVVFMKNNIFIADGQEAICTINSNLDGEHLIELIYDENVLWGYLNLSTSE